MSSIDKLPKVASVQTSDLLALFSGALGADAAATVGALLTFLQAQLAGVAAMVTQYAAPGASGFAVAINPTTPGGSDGQPVFLLLQPGGAYAAGTLTLPAVTADGQEVVVHCRAFAVTTLTVTPAAGHSTSGAPTTIAAGGFFRLRFDAVNSLWARVG